MNIIHSNNLTADLTTQIDAVPHDRLFVLADTNTARLCYPLIAELPCVAQAELIIIPAGDDNKSLTSLSHVWTELSRKGATRHSLLLNIGGGMLTDLGGFAAATLKRGISFINLPTTLLAMVDASTGGKTGINFSGLKNEVGVFCDAKAVIINTCFLHSLDSENLRSGYAEMIKHGLIADRAHLSSLLAYDFADLSLLSEMISTSVAVKERVVTEDPFEHGIRKALNLGHTVGHAIESLLMAHGHPVLHGYAVAWGLVSELYLSTLRCGFPVALMRQVVRFIREVYGACPISCKDYDELFALMTHDKKNTSGQILCTLLADVADVRINQSISRTEIEDMFDFLREG